MIVRPIKDQLVEKNRDDSILFNAIEHSIPVFARASLQHLKGKYPPGQQSRAIVNQVIHRE